MKINLTPMELIDQLRAWFHPKDRSLYLADNLYVYSQMLAWQSAISTFQNLPGLVGFWPMSSVQRSTGNAYDLSGQTRTMSYNGNPVYSFGGMAPYIELDGTGDYLSRADETDLDILGSEAIYAANVRGLTFGGWFYPGAAGAVMRYMSKWGNAGTRSYMLHATATGTHQMTVSSDGTASTLIETTSAYSTNAWYFVVGRFKPSTEVAIFTNSDKVINTTSIPAAIFSGASDLVIGGQTGGATLLTGRASLCFLCADALSDDVITALFQQTRRLFGI